MLLVSLLFVAVINPYSFLNSIFFVLNTSHYTDSIHHRQNMMVVSNPEISEFEFVNRNLIFSGLGCYNFISH